MVILALRQEDHHESKASLGYTLSSSENLPQKSDASPTPGALQTPNDSQVLSTDIVKTVRVMGGVDHEHGMKNKRAER